MGKLDYIKWLCVILILTIGACTHKPGEESLAPTLFNLLPPSHTGIDFVNQLDYTEELNTYTYKNFYNGGGVGLGDFNNDGLLDILLAGNLVPNKLYLNKGHLQFEDISVSANVSDTGVWTTGVSIADINGDGWLDIYLCKSGPPGGDRRYNELFINNGDLTFTEQAKQYGLAFEGLSTHAAFFDFDKDGDLDCYLLNNSFRSVGGYDLRVGQRTTPDVLGGNKLLRNDNGFYSDVTQQAGIYSSEIGFGLGVTIGDIDKDGWPDIYVSNDFFEKDYLYMNNRDGTFRESLEDYVQEISMGSMGADMADINNDGLPEIFVTEMLPEHDDRLKTTAQFESWDKYTLSLKSGYFRQFSRNVLQLNNGNGTFSEIARFSGVHATDWSWGALIFDMDNDGMKDIFVANGIYKELLDQDYVNFSSNPNVVREIQNRKKGIITQLIDSIPSTRISNYAFKNNGDLSFANVTKEWGLDMPTHSNGSAYGDLDNDGDLDLVLNNVNMPSQVYENRSKQLVPQNKTISLELHGENGNVNAVGSKITLYVEGKSLYQELSPMRGFMSTVDNRIHFGLGNREYVDSILVEWPDDRKTFLSHVKSDQIVKVHQKDSEMKELKTSTKLNKPVFTIDNSLKGIDFIHQENEFVDFDRDRLLFNMISNEGPCLCTGDVNNDGLLDFYIGGAKGQEGSLYVQSKSGSFSKSNGGLFAVDKESEDTDCIFFDANGDGRQDLYVTSGGNEFSGSSTALLDRLYFNRSNGNFEKSPQPLPLLTNFESTSTVISSDYDKDGDADLFVGARVIPFLYGAPANGYILKNDGKGNFENVTKEIAPELLKLGMIRDAQWIDVDNDTFSDLIVVGEWMSIHIFKNENGKFTDRSDAFGFSNTDGWYNTLEAADFNNDGFIDFVVGNHGLNSRFKASDAEPVSMYVNDFDQNGTVEHILTRYDNGTSYPFVLKQDLVMQIPSLKKKYLHYRDYKEKQMSDIFTPEQLNSCLKLNAYDFETAVWINNHNGTFSKQTLPLQAQFSPVFAILLEDFNDDGNLDILLGGNMQRAKPETGIYAATYGVLLNGNGKGQFSYCYPNESGLNIKEEIRSIKTISIGEKNYALVGKSNDKVEILNY